MLQSGRELYMQRRSKGMCRKSTPVYFTLKHTIGLCYLALLYAEQNVMLSDFSRFVWKCRTIVFCLLQLNGVVFSPVYNESWGGVWK